MARSGSGQAARLPDCIPGFAALAGSIRAWLEKGSRKRVLREEFCCDTRRSLRTPIQQTASRQVEAFFQLVPGRRTRRLPNTSTSSYARHNWKRPIAWGDVRCCPDRWCCSGDNDSARQ